MAGRWVFLVGIRAISAHWLIAEGSRWGHKDKEGAQRGQATAARHHAMGLWMIERDYEELKSELGLSHYEGPDWRGFHHHATLCIAAYGFLMLARLRVKKNSAVFRQPAVPEGFRPRGSRSDVAAQPLVVASVLFRLTRAIARALRQCPCCAKPSHDIS